MIPVLRNNKLPVKFNGTQRLFAHALFSILGKMIKNIAKGYNFHIYWDS